MKKVIRLTESDLHRIVEKSVKRILKEENDGEQLYDLWFKDYFRKIETGKDIFVLYGTKSECDREIQKGVKSGDNANQYYITPHDKSYVDDYDDESDYAEIDNFRDMLGLL